MQVEVHRKARQMLLSITDYYAEYGGTRSVDKLLDTIQSKCDSLVRFPESGTPEPLLAGKRNFYRFVILNRRIKMIYFVKGDTIHIAAFWDMRMHPDKLRKRI